MKRAICVGYSVEQNEPSRPIPTVFELPDDVKARDKRLKAIFCAYIADVEECEDFSIKVRKGKARDFGDLVVEYSDDLFMYVTFVEIENAICVSTK